MERCLGLRSLRAISIKCYSILNPRANFAPRLVARDVKVQPFRFGLCLGDEATPKIDASFGGMGVDLP